MEVGPLHALEGTVLASARSVLIVDGSEESREVLRTALERRGCTILATSRLRRGLELARQHQPDVIVLDLELCPCPEEQFAPFARETQARGASLVILGNLRRVRGELARGEFVAKPYHYGPLIRRIEQLLDAAGRPYARCA